jgi:dTDP-4-amino-4,6-dideoxygalactose transaminase
MSAEVPIAAPDVGPAEQSALERVLDDGQLADGEEVRRFEEEFATYCGANYASATTNGTTALRLALEALGIGPGDEVVTSPLSFVASANAIRHAGADPVFADVDPATLTLDPHAVERVVRDSEDVVAVLPVHLYGHPAWMNHLLDVAADNGLYVVEDACQAHGAEFDGSRVGAIGDAAAFSFYPTKNMTAGEGGMVTTHRGDVADRVARLADHGRTSGYEHAEVGYNCRMTSLCAAIGRAQLEKLTDYNLARRGNAAYLDARLTETSVETPPDDGIARPVYHQYTVRHDDRDALADHLAAAGVGTAVYYPTPIHHQPAYDDVEASCPVAERAADRVLSLPVHPAVGQPDLERIARAVEAFDDGDAASTAVGERREA